MYRRAFTLIELLVVLGVVLILAGLLLPALGGAYAKARSLEDINAVRQAAVVSASYSADYQDLYPYLGEKTLTVIAYQRWYKPLLASGHFEHISHVDAPHFRKNYPPSSVSIYLSRCVMLPPERMRPGWVIPRDEQFQVPMRTTRLAYPSQKGVFIKFFYGRIPEEQAFCIGRYLRSGSNVASPVAMGDGSVRVGTCAYFNFGSPEYRTEEGIGTPVMSTWGGVYARDVP